MPWRRQPTLVTGVRYDLHVHSAFSDGSPMAEMADAAAAAGLEGIGFADHCIPFEDAHGRRDRHDLVEHVEERRAAIEDLRESVDLRVFDAAEVSYDPAHEDDLTALLERAGFDYTIGSVHFAGGYHYTTPGAFEGLDEAALEDAIDCYVDAVVAMVESGLFDVVGHVDLVERVPALRGRLDEAARERIADAVVAADAVVEYNAGRADREWRELHPAPPLREALRSRGVAFTVGTDSHRPDELGARVDHLREAGFGADTDPV